MSEVERQIPQAADDSMMLWREYTLDDAAPFIPGIFLSIFLPVLISEFLPNIYILPSLVLPLLSIVGALIAVKTTPEHYKTTEWVTLHLRHAINPSEWFHISYNQSHDRREQKDSPDYNLAEAALGTSQRTQDVLGIEKVFPASDKYRYDTGAIERPDGTLIGAIRVEPANLTLATAGEFRESVDGLTSFVNTLDFPIQMYRTTRDFDVDRFLQSYRARRGHDDVRNEPVLENLLEQFLAWYPQELQIRGTQLIEFYIVVPLEEEEVKSSRRTQGVKDQIAEWPIISYFISDDDEETPRSVLRGKQREELIDRLERVEDGIKSIPGVDAERVSASEHADVIARAYRCGRESDLEEQLDTTGITKRAGGPAAQEGSP